MAVYSQTSFTGGEMSPRLYQRDDVGKYGISASRLLNMLPYAQGPVVRRPPTLYVNGTKNNGRVRLIPFNFGREDAYVLEFGDLYVRVYRARGVVTLSDVEYEFVSPYTTAQIEDIAWTQTADTLYLVHPEVALRTLTRTSNTNWTFATPAPSGNYRAVTFYQQRLVLAGRDTASQQLRFSRVGDFDNFAGGSADDDSFDFTLDSDRVNTILWSVPSRDTLLIGTQGGVWTVAAPNQANGFSSSNIEARRQSQVGCHTRPPAIVDQDVFFINRAQRQLRAATFDFGVDGYSTPDQAVFAEHLAKRGMVELSYQNDPETTIWMPAQDGSVLSATILKSQEVNAWAQHIIGGRLDGENAVVESTAIIPSPFGDIDDVWMTVARTINNKTVRYVEHLADPYRPSSTVDRDGGAYLDSQLGFANVITGVLTLTQASGTWVQGETATLTASTSLFAAKGERYMLRARTRGGALQRCIVSVQTVQAAGCAQVLLVTDVPPLLQGFAADEVYAEFTNVAGADHLEGETVGVVVDGATHPDRVVVGGGFTLQSPAFEVQCGLFYTSEVVSLNYYLPTDGAREDGKASNRRISRVSVDFQDTIGAEFGVEGEKLEVIPAREIDDNMDVVPALFSGTIRRPVQNSTALSRRVQIRQRTALPMTVRGLTIEQSGSR
ncbi:MAG: hypothetical protein AAF205_00285 [Pseudomonadota bacterium]